MRRYSGIDYGHFLGDIRDKSPFRVERCPTAEEKLELLERFMSQWGRI